jgi:uncharacterized protein YprB with RNaseH-like and TPR domain
VKTMHAKLREAQRTLVTTQEQLPGVVANLKGADLVALDLETTGLSPRKNSIRLLSLAAKDATYIVDCQTVDPARLFPILGESNLVAHNALFDGPDVVPKISLATSSCGPVRPLVIAATMP